MTSNKQKFLKWLEFESKEARDAETFSRNGESTDFDSGIFAGREEAFNEVIVKVNQDEEIMKCSYCPVLMGEDAKRFNEYFNNSSSMNDETREMVKRANEIAKIICFDPKKREQNEKIIKEKLLRELTKFVFDWYSESHPNTSECYVDKGAMIAKLEELNGGVINGVE